MDRTKGEMRRLRKELRREREERERQRIPIPLGTYRPSHFDRFGNEYWYDDALKVYSEYGEPY